MEYPFKDLLPQDEVTARDGYYKDWTHIDADTFHQISELVKFIREKGYGADTREAIAQALERVYHDAMKSGNADMELSMARKHFKDLASRLDASDNDLRNINVDWINKNLGKLDATFFDEDFITDLNNGVINYTNLLDDSVTRKKLARGAVGPQQLDKGVYSVNRLDTTNLMDGKFYSGTVVGQPVSLATGSSWFGASDPISVSAGDVVRFNKAFQNAYFVGVDDANILRQVGTSVSPIGTREITVSSGVTKFYTAVFKSAESDAMITINEPLPDSYVPFSEQKYTLEWLDLRNKSTQMRHLSDEVLTLIQSNSKWSGAKMITAGDSITWQDGKAYAQGPQTGQIAKGWQSHVKDSLGLESVTNIAISGRPMADGTANGVGTVSTILDRSDYDGYDLMVIASGTNDAKLNVPIGDIESLTRTTFYGAYRTAIEHILTNNPSIKLILFTPLHRNNGGLNSYMENSLGHTLLDYREAIFKLGERFSCPVVDMFSLSGISMFTLATDTMDGLHPNDSGYEKMGSAAVVGINNA